MGGNKRTRARSKGSRNRLVGKNILDFIAIPYTLAIPNPCLPPLPSEARETGVVGVADGSEVAAGAAVSSSVANGAEVSSGVVVGAGVLQPQVVTNSGKSVYSPSLFSQAQ